MPNDLRLMKLPLRFLPSRKLQIFTVLLFLFGAGILIWSMVFELSTHWSPDQQLSPGIQFISWLFMIAFLLGVLGGLVTAILRMLPGSPFFHLELTADSITNRRLWRIERRCWKELGAFVATTLPQDSDVTCIVAMAAHDTASDEKDRYKRALFRLRTSPYCGDDRVPLLAGWLNEVRLAMSDLKTPVAQVAVPRAFQSNIVGGDGRRKQSPPAPSVIER